MERGVHAYIEGEVMNGHYRNMMRRLADDLDVTGWARPLVDGRIEAIFRGTEEAVERMLDEVRSGSVTGRRREHDREDSLVDDVETRVLDPSLVEERDHFRLVHGARLTPTGIGRSIADCDNAEKKGGKLVNVKNGESDWLRCRVYGYEPLEPRHCDDCGIPE